MSFGNAPLIEWTDKGLYCAAGDFYIDPHRAVDHAIVTHAHSDHARRGSRLYSCASSGAELLRNRLGASIQVRGLEYGEVARLGEVRVSLHPAGHILGSSQVRVERDGEVWVASGDYKREPDPSCEPFESVACDTFITEATFGTPKFVWDKTRCHGKDIHAWWKQNASEGFNSLLFGYSLGKAQRILAEFAPYAERPVLIHPTIAALADCYRAQGIALARTVVLPNYQKSTQADHVRDESAPIRLEGELILAPPSILETEGFRKLGKFRTAFASGWMQGGGYARTDAYDRGFVMSDHADWEDLNRTIVESRARQVFVFHRNGALVRHLRKNGIDAHPVETLTAAAYRRLPPENLSLF